MTIPVANQNYSIANAASSTEVFITYFSTRDPGSSDINFKPTQRWFNTSNNREFILVSFTTNSSVTTANWQPLTSSSDLSGLTGNTGGKVSPTAGNINIIGSGSVSVSGNPGTSTLTISSTSGNLNVKSISSSPYVVLSGDDFLAVNVSVIPITIELPNTAATGKVYYIKDSNGNAATHNISVTTVGGIVTIDGSTTYTMNVNYQSISVVFDGANWQVF